MDVKKQTALYAVAIGAFVLWLLLRKRDEVRTFARPPVEVGGIPNMTWVVPPLELEEYGSRPTDEFDWMNGDQCGCGTGADILIIDSVRLAPGQMPGYQWQPDIFPVYTPPLKGGVSLVKNPPMPDPITWKAARPSFWWGWQGLSRVIFTSDGFTLATGLANRLWERADGGNLIQPITAIKYGAQVYELDAGRSMGL